MKINSTILARTAFAAGLALSAIGSAVADTPVSGVINSNRTWTVAQSPYVLSGEVEIRSGAVLTIQPGTVVQFEPAARLRINNGAVSAIGNAANRIVFTSVRDRVGSPTPAAAGDWDGVLVDDGASDAQTRFSYADVRFGKGMAITSASPTIDHVNFTDNAAPAIALDLASSPQGTALQASRNQVNGIAVPAGALTGNVEWRVTGIPYVLASGEITIGAVPPTLTPETQTLPPHSSGSLLLQLNGVADAGGVPVTLSSSNGSVASVPAQVTVPAGESQVSIAVNTANLGTATITATRAGLEPATATVRVANAMSVTLSPFNPSVRLGDSLTMRIAINGARPDDTVFNIQLTNPSVVSLPSTVTITAGETFADFDVQGVQIGSTMLTAGHPENYAQTNISVTSEQLWWSNPNVRVSPGVTVNETLTLSQPAPSGGVEIALQSSDVHVSVPASVTVAAGETTATIPITGVSEGSVTVSASASGYATSQTNVHVEPLKILFDMSRFDAQPEAHINSEIPLGLYDEYTLMLSSAAPAGGVTIAISNSDPTVADVAPVTVTVPGGERYATVPLRFTAVAAGETQVVASAQGLESATADIVVTPERVAMHWTQTEVVVGKSLRRSVYLSRTLDGSPFSWSLPIEVTLTNSDAAALGVPQTVYFTAYNYDLEIPLTGLALSSGPITVNATAPGLIAPTEPLTASVLAPTLTFRNLSSERSVGPRRDDFHLEWMVGPEEEVQVAAEDQTIALAIVDASPAGIVDGFYEQLTGGAQVSSVQVNEGWSYSYSAFVGAPTTHGTYGVRATLPGVGSWTATVNVTPPRLVWQPSTTETGKGLFTHVVLRRADVDGMFVPTPEDVEITLQSADPAKVTVPATVTMYAGTDYTSAEITGVDLTTQPVAITASAPGHAAQATPLSATVVAPELKLNLNGVEQGVGSARNSFYPHWQLGNQSQSAAVEQTLQLEIVDASPAGIVDGFYDDYRNGSAITTFTIRARSSSPDMPIYIGSPSAVGSYKVRVTLPGVGSWTSDTIEVRPVELRWFAPTTILGNGLKTSSFGVNRVIAGTETVSRPMQPVEVTFACANTAVCTVPATATIHPDSYVAFAEFRGTGIGITEATASAAGYATASTSVDTRTPTFEIRYLPQSMRVGTQQGFNASVLVPGSDAYFVAAQSIPVALASSQSSVLLLPASTSITAGQSYSTSFTLQANALGSATLSASAPGFTTFTSPSITVTP